MFLFKLNPVPFEASGFCPKFRGCSLEEPETDPSPEDWDDLELAVDRRGGDSPDAAVGVAVGIMISKTVILA